MCIVTGTTVPVVFYRSFLFVTGIPGVCYRNTALAGRYVTGISSKFHTPLIGHRPIHKVRRGDLWGGRNCRLKFVLFLSAIPRRFW